MTMTATREHHPFPLNTAIVGPAKWRVFCRACGDLRPRDVGQQEFPTRAAAMVVVVQHKEANL